MEGVTALAIATSLILPLGAALAALPAIRHCLEWHVFGTLRYGPELAPADKRQRAFGLFYTVTIGAGALSPPCMGSSAMSLVFLPRCY
jgi:MFS transporter, FSR family, fosmidomycin resistance protein